MANFPFFYNLNLYTLRLLVAQMMLHYILSLTTNQKSLVFLDGIQSA